MNMKRQILTQRGGIIPALILIIVPSIGATGTVGAAYAGCNLCRDIKGIEINR